MRTMAARLSTLLLACAACAPFAAERPAPTQPALSTANRLHVQALESFRQGRFSEAYGRFIQLAEVGHPASAKYALWMCEHGLDFFKTDWDCAPHDVEEWAMTAAVVAPVIGPRHYAAKPKAR